MGAATGLPSSAVRPITPTIAPRERAPPQVRQRVQLVVARQPNRPMIGLMPEAGTSPALSALAPAAPGPPNVLIVGARGGLGRALADVYRERGWTVQAVTRDRCD